MKLLVITAVRKDPEPLFIIHWIYPVTKHASNLSQKIAVYLHQRWWCTREFFKTYPSLSGHGLHRPHDTIVFKWFKTADETLPLVWTTVPLKFLNFSATSVIASSDTQINSILASISSGCVHIFSWYFVAKSLFWLSVPNLTYPQSYVLQCRHQPVCHIARTCYAYFHTMFFVTHPPGHQQACHHQNGP